MSIMCINQYFQYIVNNTITYTNYITQYISPIYQNKSAIIHTISNQSISNISNVSSTKTVQVPITLSTLNKSFSSYYQHIYENNSYYEHNDDDDENIFNKFNCNYCDYLDYYRTQDQTKITKTYEPHPESLLF